MTTLPKYRYEFVVADGQSATTTHVDADRHETKENILILYRDGEETGRYMLDKIVGWGRRPLARIGPR